MRVLGSSSLALMIYFFGSASRRTFKNAYEKSYAFRTVQCSFFPSVIERTLRKSEKKTRESTRRIFPFQSMKIIITLNFFGN